MRARRSPSALLLPLVLGLVGCSSAATGFGPMADLVISSGALSLEQRQSLSDLRLAVTGDEQYLGTTQSAWQLDEVRSRYVARRGTRALHFVVSASLGGVLVAEGAGDARFDSDSAVQTVRIALGAPGSSAGDAGAGDLGLVDAGADAMSLGDAQSGADAAGDLASPLDSGLIGYTCNQSVCSCPAATTCSGALPPTPTLTCEGTSTCTATAVSTGTCSSGATCDLSAVTNGQLTCALGSTQCVVRCPTPPCVFHCPGTCKVYCGGNALLTVTSVTTVNCN